jgi:hypothetical protein
MDDPRGGSTKSAASDSSGQKLSETPSSGFLSLSSSDSASSAACARGATGGFQKQPSLGVELVPALKQENDSSELASQATGSPQPVTSPSGKTHHRHRSRTQKDDKGSNRGAESGGEGANSSHSSPRQGGTASGLERSFVGMGYAPGLGPGIGLGSPYQDPGSHSSSNSSIASNAVASARDGLVFLSMIGKGSSGSVYKCLYMPTLTFVAVSEAR